MGLGMFRGCFTAPSEPAPNPDQKRWELLERWQFENGYVLKVRYLDCTNFEGVKVMVYRGVCSKLPRKLDPHFSEGAAAPFARFRPGDEGIELACALARSL